TCGKFHTEHRCFSRLDDAWRAEFGDDVERPRWTDLLRSGVAIFDLDYDAIISAMYAFSFSAEGDCYRCVSPDPSIAAAAQGARASSTPHGTAPAEALHTFTLDYGASRYFFHDNTTLTPLPAPIPARLADPSGGPVVARSSTVLPCQVAASCSCHLLSHQTLLWHHRLVHPSLPLLRGMHSLFLGSGLPRPLPPLPPSLAPPCLPCVEGRQRAAPHSSLLPLTTAPLQTLHMDVWGPARVSGQGRERYFLLVVDDYTRYTTVFPFHNKGEVPDVLIPWTCTVRLELRERFGTDLPVLRLHSDRGGEFSSDRLRDFSRGEGILQSFTLSDSPQQNGIAERRIGLVMEGSRAFIRDTSADKLSACAIPCVFLGTFPDVPGWQFYEPTSRHILTSQDVTFDESVPFYRLFPYRSAPPPPPPLFLTPGPPPEDPFPPQGPAHSGVSELDPLPDTTPVQVAIGSGAAPSASSRGPEPGGAGSEGAGSGGAEPGGAEPEGVEPGGAESEDAKSGGAALRSAASSGAPVAEGAGETGAGGAAVTTGAGGTVGVRA
ncbi:unnamed protein product, partial [Closterium sp. NIES-54]